MPPELARSAERLGRLDVQLSVVEGTVLGSVMVQPLRFDPLEPVIIHPLQRFEVLPAEKIRVIGSSPLAHLGPVSFASVPVGGSLAQLLELAWREHVRLVKAALVRARQLARDAQLLLDPWRVEGSLLYNGERVQLLFSSKGDRACVSGLNGRPTVKPPRLPRVILSVDPTDDFLETDRKWRVAIEQARACLGPTEDVVPEEGQLSLDIASRDLETSYDPEPPPRLPPPRAPSPIPDPPRAPPPSAAKVRPAVHGSLSARPPPAEQDRPRQGPAPRVMPAPATSPAAAPPKAPPRPAAPLTALPALNPRVAEANPSLDLTSDDLP